MIVRSVGGDRGVRAGQFGRWIGGWVVGGGVGPDFVGFVFDLGGIFLVWFGGVDVRKEQLYMVDVEAAVRESLGL